MNPTGLALYNTLTHTKEPLVPLLAGEISMYVCGPTVYDLSHVGHARKEVIFDVIVRYLRFRGFQVNYVRNVTDVDDKIIIRAQQEGVSWEEVARRNEESFHQDLIALGTIAPDHEPRATETIDEMLELIRILCDKGIAYETEGGVYFSVSEWDQYGALSRRKTEELMAGARVEVDVAKKSALDFALWKASKPGEPAWASPWGEGRPGWHIECSAMSRKYLGETLDIHGGGVDLVFPHHENEIAQSEAATGKTYCRYWIHNGLLTVRKEKMSKSLGNYITIRDALGKFHAETIRLFFLSHHYRSPVDFTDESLAEARKNLDYFYNTLMRIGEICGKEEGDSSSDDPVLDGNMAGSHLDPEEGLIIQEFPGRFQQEMDDDFNTAEAIGELFRAATVINRWIDHGDHAAREEGRDALRLFRRQMKDVGEVLGLFQADPLVWFRQGGKTSDGGGDEISEEIIEEKVRQREEARKNKDWQSADHIRDELAGMGIVLEDAAHGTRWKRQG